MNITQVYLVLNDTEYDLEERSSYQKKSNYLTLFISEKIKSLKLELGKFNRVIFQEGYDYVQDHDLSVVGDKAFLVRLTSKFRKVQAESTEQELHVYFSENYLEGFNKFDRCFNLNLKEAMQSEIDSSFKEGLKYESVAKIKKNKNLTVRVIHRYTPDRYSLVAQKLDKQERLLHEDVICTCEPDPFLAKFEVSKVEIKNDLVVVTNGLGNEHVIYDFSQC